MAQLLLQHRADVNTGDSTGATPLIGAVIKQHQDMVRLLLAAGAAPGKKEAQEAGNTALHIAAQHGDVGILEELIRAGAPVSGPAARNNFGFEPLAHAASFDRAQAVEALLAAGAGGDGCVVETRACAGSPEQPGTRGPAVPGPLAAGSQDVHLLPNAAPSTCPLQT